MVSPPIPLLPRLTTSVYSYAKRHSYSSNNKPVTRHSITLLANESHLPFVASSDSALISYRARVIRKAPTPSTPHDYAATSTGMLSSLKRTRLKQHRLPLSELSRTGFPETTKYTPASSTELTNSSKKSTTYAESAPSNQTCYHISKLA